MKFLIAKILCVKVLFINRGSRRTNIHNEEKSGRPFIVNDELVQKIYEKVVKTGGSQSELFKQFMQISLVI